MRRAKSVRVRAEVPSIPLSIPLGGKTAASARAPARPGTSPLSRTILPPLRGYAQEAAPDLLAPAKSLRRRSGMGPCQSRWGRWRDWTAALALSVCELSLMPTMALSEFRLSGFEAVSKPRAPESPAFCGGVGHSKLTAPVMGPKLSPGRQGLSGTG
jgi:hypothetical protein